MVKLLIHQEREYDVIKALKEVKDIAWDLPHHSGGEHDEEHKQIYHKLYKIIDILEKAVEVMINE